MDLIKENILILIILLPLIGAALIFITPGYLNNIVKYISLIVSFITFLISILIFILYDINSGGVQLLWDWEWLSLKGAWALGDKGITLNLGVDGISVMMVLLTGSVMLTGVMASWNIQSRSKDFFILYFLLLAGVFGVFVSYDMFFFFLFYELSVMPMFLLIGYWGSSSDFRTFIRTKEYAAMKLTLFLVAGSVLIWVAIIAIFVQAGLGSFNILEIQKVVDDKFPLNFQQINFFMIMIGFGILAGMWPFHTWSPDGHVAAPTSGSMVHAGVLMKLGVFGIIRIGMTFLPEGANSLMPVLMILGCVNVIYGAFSALGQTDLKYVVGYSSVSHMGYVLMGLASMEQLGLTGAVYQMFSHGIMTALFFLAVGAIYHSMHTRDTLILKGLIKKMPYISVFFVLAGLTSLGLPGLSGFAAEILIFLGVFKSYGSLGILFGSLAVIGAGITAIYILRLVSKVFFGVPDENKQNINNNLDATKFENIAGIILVGLILFAGLYPLPFIDMITSGVTPLLSNILGAL